MSSVVWKYPIPFGRTEIKDLPVGAKIVHVGIDPASQYPCVWIERDADPAAPLADSTLKLHVVGTGHPVDDEHLAHVGSTIEPAGLVWHIYRECTPAEALVRSS